MCRYSQSNCSQYIGKMVRVQTANGVHHGVVDQVSSKGIYMRPMQTVSGDAPPEFRTLAQEGQELNADPVFYPGYGYGYGYGGYGAARFFIPFLTILALTSLLFW
jgi:hypothetical protein